MPLAPDAESALHAWGDSSDARFGELIAGKLSDEDHPHRYSRGTWTVAYAIEGAVNIDSKGQLQEALMRVKGHETGWPPWLLPSPSEAKPYPYEELRRVLDGSNRQRLRGLLGLFWRASEKGQLYLVRAYAKDNRISLRTNALRPARFSTLSNQRRMSRRRSPCRSFCQSGLRRSTPRSSTQHDGTASPGEPWRRCSVELGG